jgi:hypothetical protein
MIGAAVNAPEISCCGPNSRIEKQGAGYAADTFNHRYNIEPSLGMCNFDFDSGQ